MYKSGKHGELVPKDAYNGHQRRFDREANDIFSSMGMGCMDLDMRRDRHEDIFDKLEHGFGGMHRMEMGIPSFGNMFGDMHKHFEDSFKHAHQQMMRFDSKIGGSGGTVSKKVYYERSEMGKDGAPPQIEQYKSSAMKSSGHGNTVSERQQLYHNSETGLHKAAHERMMNNQGRKLVKEKLGPDSKEYEHYRNIRPDNAGNFDKEWNEMRHKLKFDSGMSGRALPFAKAGHQKSSEYRSGNYNDREKGYFMDDRFKRENNPVPYRNRPVEYEEERKNYADRRGLGMPSDIAPVILGQNREGGRAIRNQGGNQGNHGNQGVTRANIPPANRIGGRPRNPPAKLPPARIG